MADSPLPPVDSASLLAHAGRPAGGGGPPWPVNPPLLRASTLLFDNCAALRASHGSRSAYGRDATSTTLALEQALCQLEGYAHCLLAPSGLAAISTALLALLQPGDDLLLVDCAYEPTRQFCAGTLARLGISTRYFAADLGGEIARLLLPNTRGVLLESPGSHTLEMQDVPAIAAAAHAHGAWVMADATWLTPLGWSARRAGVDVVLHSATKYLGGHADLLLGAMLCDAPLHERLSTCHRELGICVDADSAWLALRGLRSLAPRLRQHGQSALAVAHWLRQRPEVEQVLYPPLPGAPGHELWRRDCHAEYAAGLMGVVLAPGISATQRDRLVDATRLFGIGYSWGAFESLILPVSVKRRPVTGNRWRDRALLRLHIGLESPVDLIADLQQAFDQMGS